MNKSYVKQYDEKGILTNPIIGKYTHDSNNRKFRREPLQKSRFFGNGRNHPLAIYGKFKYKKVIQSVSDKLTGANKRIEHYIIAK